MSQRRTRKVMRSRRTARKSSRTRKVMRSRRTARKSSRTRKVMRSRRTARKSRRTRKVMRSRRTARKSRTRRRISVGGDEVKNPHRRWSPMREGGRLKRLSHWISQRRTSARGERTAVQVDAVRKHAKAKCDQDIAEINAFYKTSHARDQIHANIQNDLQLTKKSCDKQIARLQNDLQQEQKSCDQKIAKEYANILELLLKIKENASNMDSAIADTDISAIGQLALEAKVLDKALEALPENLRAGFGAGWARR
jgi:hypothetical protein